MKYSKSKKIFYYILIVLLVTAVVFVSCELAIRFLIYQKGIGLAEVDANYYEKLRAEDPPHQFNKMPFYDTTHPCGMIHTHNNKGVFRGFKYPDAEFRSKVTINSSGFRDEDDFDILKSEHRVAFLGDSFIEAIYVDDSNTISELFEARLKDKGVSVRSFNFGVSSIGTVHQHCLFFEEILKIKPHAVILTIFPNDIVDNSPYYIKTDESLIPRFKNSDAGLQLDGFGMKKEDQGLIEYTINPKAVSNEKIFRFLYAKTGKLLEFFPKLKILHFVHNYLPQFFGMYKQYSYEFDVYKKRYPEPLEEAFNISVRMIKELNEYCKKNDIEFFVVSLPAREQVHTDFFDKYVKARRIILDRRSFDLNLPQSRLSKRLEEENIKYLDLLPDFHAVKNDKQLYFSFDHHLNEEGNEFVVDQIIKGMQTRSSWITN